MIELIENGKTPPIIILGIIALSARFSVDPAFASIPQTQRGIPYAQAAEKLLSLHDISLTTIQASILLGAFWAGQGDPALESVYICTATRMGQLLEISSRPTSTSVERELNLQTWCSLCMIDVWSSHGIGLPRAGTRRNEVPRITDEIVLLQLTPLYVDRCTTSSSLIAEMFKLNRILAEIHELNEDSVEGHVNGQPLERRVDALSMKLDEWLQELPEYMRDNPENLAHYASIGLGRVFVAVYCGYYHFGQLLYYQFLHLATHGPSSVTVHSYARRCKMHASALCEIIYASHSTPGCDVLYSMVGHVLVIASTVQIHSLLFSNSDEEIKAARSRLERNFEILLHLYNLWSTVAMSLLRLRVFHTACHRSTETSFVMDRWMLQFLGEFGRAVDERTEPFPEDIPLSLGAIGLANP